MKAAQIVLIEDNPADVLLVRKALEQNGIQHALTPFANGEDAIQALCTETGKPFVPDAILLDLNIPRQDGFEVLHRLQEFPRLSGVPITILTSSRDQKDKHRAAIHGAPYVEKPCRLHEFMTSVGWAVKEMLAGSIAGKS